MQDNPAEEWQRLTEHYREMRDGELEELANAFGDLTETAQEVLRNELRNRGMADPGAKDKAPRRPDAPTGTRWASSVDADGGDNRLNDGDGNQEDGLAREYTWKTPLCECDTAEQALAICAALRQAGIESWYERPGSGWGISGPRIVVAADRLNEAREIAARPIAQEIIDSYREEVPEFEAPKCPSCGAEDPVLESAEPSNQWLCEGCGNEWSEPEAGEAENAGR